MSTDSPIGKDIVFFLKRRTISIGNYTVKMCESRYTYFEWIKNNTIGTTIYLYKVHTSIMYLFNDNNKNYLLFDFVKFL